MYNKPDHHLFLTWLILTGIIAFALFCSWYEGVLSHLFSVDRSHISWAIALSYLLISLHCLYRTWVISQQHLLSQQLGRLITTTPDKKRLTVEKDTLLINDTPAPNCVISDYLQELLTRSGRDKDSELRKEHTDLISVYEMNLKGPQGIGWFAADMMLKLGLLGTIIGFIFMLASVADIGEFDVATIQKILGHMSTGMGTALYTTLAGLVCSLLASLQYHLIDQNCDDLLTMARHLTVFCSSE